MNEATLPETSATREHGLLPAPLAVMLVVAWSSDEPWRVGEVCLLPVGDPGPWRVFGRGEAQASDPHPRLQFMRLRPASSSTTGYCENLRVSRVQILMRAREQAVEVNNLGRAELSVNGTKLDTGEVRPGDIVQVGRQLLLFCCKRPAWEDPLPEFPDFPFGEPDIGGFIGESAVSWSIRRQIVAAARDVGHVLITGASGTGKELVACAIHALSSRAGRTLVSRNAATFPETLVDAELFGNARNYPNSGMSERVGLIGEAHQSTLFLDEIGELPASLQAHLLRVLDSGEYQRLGDSGTRKADIRVIAATNRDFSHLKHDFLARFRIRLNLPDLNTRREDVPLIARALAAAAPIDGATSRKAQGEEFPGALGLSLTHKLLSHRYTANVRELDRMLRDATLGVNTEDIGAPDRPGNSDPPPARRVDPTSITP